MNDSTPFDPTLTQFDTSDSAIRRTVGAVQMVQRGQINQGLEANPDQAAEAVNLSGLTGDSPEWIAQDVDQYKAKLRQSTAQALVMNNPALTAYLQSHPMASSVSNDDWGNLDKYTRDSAQTKSVFNLLNPMPELTGAVSAAAPAAMEGFAQGFGDPSSIVGESGQLASYITDRAKHPSSWEALRVLGVGADLFARIMSGAFSATVGAAGAGGEAWMRAEQQKTGWDLGAEQFGKTAAAMAEWAPMRGDMPLHQPLTPMRGTSPLLDVAKHDEFIKQQTMFNEAVTAAKPWVDAGLEPPPGVHPLIDQGKAQLNSAVVDQLEKNLESAMASTTRGRAPGMFADGINKPLYGDTTIGIHPDGVKALYGEKLPKPDDGLLGWVPNIESQLANARETGSDIEIPLKDWFANVDPQVAKGLHDDIRVWPGGITAREAQEPIEPRAVIDGALPQVRAASGLEPMFSIGDRKLTLDLKEKLPSTVFVGTELPEAHNWNILDERGQPVGDMQIIPAKDKTLYVNWIGGKAGMWANNFGYSLIRDLKRQLKEAYPDYDKLTGFRVTGAREQAGQNALAKVKLSADEISMEDFNKTRGILSNGWAQYANNSRIMVKDAASADWSPEQVKFANAAMDELQRITGGKVGIEPTAGIFSTKAGQAAGGVFMQFRGHAPTILLDMLRDNVIGTGRHEAVHFLRAYGFFKDGEWEALEKAAKAENWADRYGINERYAHLTDEQRTEESIAEAFREWAGQAPEVRPKTGVGVVFQKIMDLFDAIKAKLGFGPEETWESVFQKIHSGEVGQRPAGEPRAAGAFDIRESIEGFDNIKAASLGIDADTFKRIQAGMEKQHEEDIEAATKRAVAEQTKRQTKEWKANRAEMAKTVAQDIRQRPDIASDLFLGSGELFGKKLRQRYTLAADELTPEQKAALPKEYVSKEGLPPDLVANMFGYNTGKEMVDHLAALEVAKKTPDGGRMPTGEFLRQTIQAETDRRLEREHGFLEKNIMEDARDQALSETSFNVMHEQLMAAAIKAGVTVFDKYRIKQAAKDLINDQIIGQVNSFKLMQQMGKHSRDAEKALAAGDWRSAAIAMQQQTVTMAVAQEARALEKYQAKFDKVAKRYAKPYNPTKNRTAEGNFSIFTRDILQRVNLKNGMNPAWLQEAISKSGFTDLTDFVAKTEKAWEIAGVELPVPDFVLNSKNLGDLKAMKVEDAKAVMDAVTALDKLGRGVNKIEREGAAQDKTEWVAAAGKQLGEKFEPRGVSATKTAGEEVAHVFNTAVAAMTNNETLLQRFDGRDPHGMFTETITYPAAEAANYEARLQRETAQAMAELGEIKDPEKQLSSPFIDPLNGKPLANFTRRNLAAVISNMGNDYNWNVLAQGWKVDPDVLWKWVESVTTVEDIERAQKMAGVFKGLKTKSDVVYQNMYGVTPQSVVPRPFTMHGKQFDGWYHPVIADAQRSAFANKLKLETPSTFWPSTSDKYMKRRTGKIQAVDLSYDMISMRLGQEVHNIAFRQVVHNTANIYEDNTFRQDITRYYGKEYMEEMDEWLNRVAGSASYRSGALGLANRISDNIRQNVVSTQIAFNLGTIEKHGLTAWMMSSRELGPNLFKTIPQFAKITAEVGADSFHHAVMDLFGHDPLQSESLWNFAKENSEEIQRRSRNYLDTMIGQQRQMEGQSGLRSKVSQVGAKLVAFSDMLSAVPLWVAKYREEFDANGGVHGYAVRVADMAVRRAHGSTAITSLPRIASGNNPITPWMTSLYGFMGTSMQRRIEIFHDINDMYKLGMKGDINAAAGKIPAILASTAVYVVWTGLVEEAITGQFTDDHRGLGEKALMFAFTTAAQSIIALRDLVHDLETGQDSGGLISTPIHDANNIFHDMHRGPDQAPQFSRQRAGKFIQDSCTAIGDLSGLCPKHVGTALRYGIDAFDEYQRPRSAADVYRGVVSGQQKLRVVK